MASSLQIWRRSRLGFVWFDLGLHFLDLGVKRVILERERDERCIKNLGEGEYDGGRRISELFQEI